MKAAPEVAQGPSALREKGALTRLMILRELARGRPTTMRSIAETVGVTAQAISDHVKRLIEEGHVLGGNDGPRITARGVAYLDTYLREIKGYVDGALRHLDTIDRCGAIAGADVAAGQRVGLVMEHGQQVAYPDRTSSSTGVAVAAARKGQDIAVERLEGVLELTSGIVTIGVLPDAVTGGSRNVDLDALHELATTAGLVVTRGPVAHHLAADLGLPCVAFGHGYAAAEAAVRGVDVLVLAEEEEVNVVRAAFDEAAAGIGLHVVPRVVRLHR